MKKLFSLFLVLVLLFSFCSCSEPEEKKVPSIYDVDHTIPFDIMEMETKDFKFGLILLNDEQNIYDKGFVDDLELVINKFELTSEQMIIKPSVSVDKAYSVAAELANAGCDIIFANSSDYETELVKAAKDYKAVQFCVVGATTAKTAKVGNFHAVYPSVFEARYLNGVAAGMKLKELISADDTKKAKIGFVASFNNAESISAYTAFYLGAKSVVESVEMDVKYVDSYVDATEQKAADSLINGGCQIISYNTMSLTVPTVCDEANVYSVGSYTDTVALFPKTSLTAYYTSWEYYFEFIIGSVLNATSFPSDYLLTTDVGGANTCDVNEAIAAKSTALYVKSARASLLNGRSYIFDISKFTYKNKPLNSYLADVVDDGKGVGDSEAVANGCFNESAMRSAPYFDIVIDGINIKK